MKKPDLGTPITRYNLKELRWKDLLREFLPRLILVLVPTLYGLWRTLYGYSNFGPAAAANWGRDWFLAGGGLLVLLLIYSFNRLKKAHTWVELYSWGLLFHFPPNRRRQIKWEDVTGLTSFSVTRTFLGIGKKTRQHLILHSRQSPSVACHPGIKDLEGLKKTIKRQVYGRLKPGLVNAFKQGKTLGFGEVSVSKKSLLLPKGEIPWEFVEGIDVQKGVFQINLSAQKRIEIPIRKLHNLEILIHLIRTEI